MQLNSTAHNVNIWTRRELIGALGATAARGKGGRKPNLLFIHADDHAGYVLGCDGNRKASTPNLDRLAAEGVRFAKHYCNSPVCTPSRQSFLTGQMPFAAGVTTLSTALSTDKPTTAKALKAAGYRTEVIGKMHFNRPAEPGMHGFDRLLTEREWQKQYATEVVARATPPDVRVKPQWRPFRDPARIWLNAEKLPYGRFDEDMPGTFLAREACRRLDELKDSQFALWVSFHEPHSPFDFPIEFRDRFEAAGFNPPIVGAEDPQQIPLIFRDLTPDDKRGIIAAYYTSTAFLDRNIGMVLDHLRKLRLEEDTLVVYMPDHGYDLGHHGRFEKHCGYDPAMRVPLIIRWPGHISRGKTIRQFTESVDVPHTVLDLLGVDALPVVHGSSLRPYLTGGKPAHVRDHIASVYLENEEGYIRTDRWKYIHCTGQRRRTDGYETDRPTPGRYVRLYDLKADPGEFHDVASQHPEVVHELRTLLLNRFRLTHPEAPNAPKADDVEQLEWFLRPRDAAKS
jgi:choline-sulfatase